MLFLSIQYLEWDIELIQYVLSRESFFFFEFKVGDNEYKKTTIDQVMDYALDLKYFHEESKRRYIVPICVSTKASVQKMSTIVAPMGYTMQFYVTKII